MESGALITTVHAEMNMDNLHLCSSLADTGEQEEESKTNLVKKMENYVGAESTESDVDFNHSKLMIIEETKANWKETGDILEHSNNLTGMEVVKTAELGTTDITLKSTNNLSEECLQLGKSEIEVAAGDVFSLEIEFRKPPEGAAGKNMESRELLLDGRSWEHITNWTENSTEQNTGSSTRDSSDSSTISAVSLNGSTGDMDSLQSDSWIMQRQLIEPELRTDEINLVSCDSLSPRIEYIKTFDLNTTDISMVPMESLHLSLVSDNNLLLAATGTGPTSLHSINLATAGADWHMGSVPVKCLQLGAVNVASLTLGTVGISVIPMVSAPTKDTNPFTESIGMVPMESPDWDTISADSEKISLTCADHVNVDSITQEGVRERWHPLEDRLYALGEALTNLDKKLERFSPRLQEAEILLNDMECSLAQHAMHINDITNENTDLAQRILQLEERMRSEKQHHFFDRECEGES